MRTAKEILQDRLGVEAYKTKLVNSGIEGFVIAAVNEAIVEAIEECSDWIDPKTNPYTHTAILSLKDQIK